MPTEGTPQCLSVPTEGTPQCLSVPTEGTPQCLSVPTEGTPQCLSVHRVGTPQSDADMSQCLRLYDIETDKLMDTVFGDVTELQLF